MTEKKTNEHRIDRLLANRVDEYLHNEASEAKNDDISGKNWRFKRLLDNKYINIIIVLILVGVLIWVFTKISFIFEPIVTFVQIISLPIIFAAVIYYLSVPLVNRLEKRGINRTIGTIILFVIIILFIIGLISLFPIVLSQGQDFARDWTSIWTAYQTQLNSWINADWYSDIQTIMNKFVTDFEIPSSFNFTQIANSTIEGIGSIVGTVTRVVVALVTAPIILFYMLRDGHKLPAYILGFVPVRIRKGTGELFSRMNGQISTYVRGQILVAIAVSIMFVIGYLIIGLPYGVIIGILAGFLNIIPFLGSFFAMVPAIIVGIVVGPGMLLKVLIVFAIEQTIESRIISPQILGNNLKIHPITIMLLLIAGADLFGFLGIILIIPIYAVLKVIGTYFFEWYSSVSGLYEDIHDKSDDYDNDQAITSNPISHEAAKIDEEFHR